MLWGMFVASLVTWAFAVISSHTLGGRVHVLLAVAIGIVVVRLVHDHREARAEKGSSASLTPSLLARRMD